MKFYFKIIRLISLPLVLEGISFKVLLKIYKIRKNIPQAISFYDSIRLFQEVLQAPKGDVVECGSYKGGSTAVLSLACKQTNKKLHIFDSFCGLPDTNEIHHYLSKKRVYRQGEYMGTLKEVSQNIVKCGCLEVCSFHQGYFKDTLPQFQSIIGFAFLDVDLSESLETCIKYIYPQLEKEAKLMIHEIEHQEMCEVFRKKELHLVGAGSGLPLNRNFAAQLGYVKK